MNPDVAYLVAGIGLLLGSVLPRLLRERALSAPVVVIAVGAAFGLLAPRGEPISPLLHTDATAHLAEATVIVALMGVGLAIDRPLSWRRWRATWRLLGIAMPLSIAGVALLGWWAMALTPAAAVLLGGVLAPTDPVLASDVQVEGPASGDDPAEEEDEVRFALTSEAGLNDGLAFPFVYLGIFMASKGAVGGWLPAWFGWELAGKIAIGVGVGWGAGWVLGRVAFRSRVEQLRLAEVGEPMLAIAATFAVYGLAQLVGGYGFLSVFVAALAIRAAEPGHEYHADLHRLTEQLELILTLAVLLLLGASLTSGLLSSLTWGGALVAVALVLVIRPLFGWLSLGGHCGLGPKERWVTAVFGVRGIGSIYYLAFAAGQATFPAVGRLWSTVGFAIVLSVVVHGIGATPVMAWLERRRQRTGLSMT